ncbi:MAG: DNA gyrase/topoisomerase IV subunit A [Cytophagales bacterium]|nr:DNA gyrase/topoisomerase IV subunit A [Cytophagales bacterium]
MSEDNINKDLEGSVSNENPVSDLYEDWFLDYASYVILERAIPSIDDGLKPVQRRILHSMNNIEDGRYNKCANIIGSSMQFHPHGDASIEDALVNLGQKDLLIDTQGNWGDVRTGDKAAASRYIEARISRFGIETLFNEKTTEWKLSYDGRKKEPINLPVKFPLLLAQGVEGIAVGLSTKIMPHNFCELIKSSISYLKEKSFKLYPDFPNGGMVDITDYNDGKRGGKIRVRSKIRELDKSTLIIDDIPYNTTTTNLIDSIIKANDKGKIKIRKVLDNTAEKVEVLVHLHKNQSPSITIDALYAFTDCEISISPNACVIVKEKPQFLGVKEVLKYSADSTKSLLKKELEIKRNELKEKILFSTLERIFIENKIYQKIEDCETWNEVIETIDKGLDPYKKDFYREIVKDDIVKLTEIKIKRISKFDKDKLNDSIIKLNEELDKTNKNLKNIVEYTIDYYYNILNKYGKGRERKTDIIKFDTIKVKSVAANNVKLYVNRKEGFIGYGIKKEEFVCNCSDIDDIITFCADGSYKIVKIQDKVFVGKNIVLTQIWKKSDKRMVFNAAYLDVKKGFSYVKRFQVTSATKEKTYNLGKGDKGSKLLYIASRPNGESEVVTVHIHASQKARKKVFDYDFSEIEIKGKAAKGNILSKYRVRVVKEKSVGLSTLSGIKIYYDNSIGRLNTDQRGEYLGKFNGDDMIIVVYKDGNYELTSFELTNRYDWNNVLFLDKYRDDGIMSAAYYDGKLKNYYVKRFNIETNTINKKFLFVSQEKGSKLEYASFKSGETISFKYFINKKLKPTEIKLDNFIDVKGWKSIGNKINFEKIRSGTFSLLGRDEDTTSEENKVLPENKDNKEIKQENFDVGESLELDLDSDQLNLFNEKD